MMNCDLACGLMDEYLDDRLSHRDRERIEEHLNRCLRCRQELESRLAFDDLVRHRLTAAVSSLQLPRESTHRIIQAAQRSTQRALWSKRLVAGGQVALGVAAVILLMVGLIYSLGRVPTPLQGSQVEVAGPKETRVQRQQDAVWIEPPRLYAGEPFTVTLRLRNETSQPLDGGLVVFSLKRAEATGPEYRFAIPLGEVLQPDERWEVELTPQNLRPVCLREYQIEPAELLAEPGVYSFRVTFQPAVR
jgi:hypothetical protein